MASDLVNAFTFIIYVLVARIVTVSQCTITVGHVRVSCVLCDCKCNCIVYWHLVQGGLVLLFEGCEVDQSMIFGAGASYLGNFKKPLCMLRRTIKRASVMFVTQRYKYKCIYSAIWGREIIHSIFPPTCDCEFDHQCFAGSFLTNTMPKVCGSGSEGLYVRVFSTSQTETASTSTYDIAAKRATRDSISIS